MPCTQYRRKPASLPIPSPSPCVPRKPPLLGLPYGRACLPGCGNQSHIPCFSYIIHFARTLARTHARTHTRSRPGTGLDSKPESHKRLIGRHGVDGSLRLHGRLFSMGAGLHPRAGGMAFVTRHEADQLILPSCQSTFPATRGSGTDAGNHCWRCVSRVLCDCGYGSGLVWCASPCCLVRGSVWVM
jgi:hypothetical protein